MRTKKGHSDEHEKGKIGQNWRRAHTELRGWKEGKAGE
jgi:hypothetical protein